MLAGPWRFSGQEPCPPLPQPMVEAPRGVGMQAAAQDADGTMLLVDGWLPVDVFLARLWWGEKEGTGSVCMGRSTPHRHPRALKGAELKLAREVPGEEDVWEGKCRAHALVCLHLPGTWKCRGAGW